MKYTIDQIATAAKGACFYVTPEGLWLRMQYCDMDEGTFMATDEDSGEDYSIDFEAIVAAGEEPEFHHLTRTVISVKESEVWSEP